MTPLSRRIIGGVAIIIGLGLFFVRADRATISLLPTPGADNAVSLDASHRYVIEFHANRAAITRIGLYLTAASDAIPNKDITLTAYSAAHELLGMSALPSRLIDNTRTSQWRFAAPLANNSGDTVRVELATAPELNGLLKMKTRLADGTFNDKDIALFIDGQPQGPIGYEVYTEYHPPLALQIGGLLLLAGIAVFIPRASSPTIREIQLVVIALALALLACLPAIVLGGIPFLLILTQTCALYGAYHWLRANSHSELASFKGAIVFSFTSWFALHIGADRAIYALAAGLPLLALLGHKTISKPTRLITRLLYIILFVSAIMQFGAAHFSLPTQTASLRDIFLDPNQTQYSIKTADPNLTWDNFGAYVGIIPLALVIIGTLRRRAPWLKIAGLLVTFGILASFPLAAHAAIIPVWLIAYLTASGTDRLHAFLGAHNRLIQWLLMAVGIIILLDLWQVLTPILEYPLL